ncbi:MAG: hypothetical protein GXY36_12540 [Chloroflexi bacterium]|nr:hypothetical protein [Chloroflexota bacterium]
MSTPELSPSPSGSTTTPAASAPSRPARLWIGRAAGIVFGLLLAWLLIEVLLRVLFFSLPPRLQLVLDQVRVTPFSDRTLLPDPVWQPDNEYLTIARPVQGYEQFGSAEVRFEVDTETLWGSRAAFRTQQALVDQHVDGVAIGDSFTFCFTEADDCWVQQLSTLTGRNIINLGIVSTGSVSHARVLANFGMPLQPPLVIWQWWGNDANEDYGLAALRGETEVQSPHPPAPARAPNWWDRNSAVYVLLKLFLGEEDEFEGSLQFLDRETATEGDLRLAFGRPYLWDAFDMAQPHNQYGWERTQQALIEAQGMVESYGGTLLVVLIPTKEQVYRELAGPLIGAERMALLDRNYALMQDFCEGQALTCLDLLPVLREVAQRGEQLYYTTDIHLNPRGNAVLAETLAAWLDAHPDVFGSAP